MQTAVETAPQQAPVFSAASVLTGGAMTLALVAGMIGGLVHGWTEQVAMLILIMIPICTVGTALAIISLIWRRENKALGQAGLWLNGMLAFFGVPILMFWLLA